VNRDEDAATRGEHFKNPPIVRLEADPAHRAGNAQTTEIA